MFKVIALLSALLLLAACQARQPKTRPQTTGASAVEYGRGQPVIEVQSAPLPIARQIQGQTDLISVLMTDTGFQPATIQVRSGQRVKLRVQNRSNAPHNLVIERFGIFSRTLQPGEENYIEFTASQAGNWPIFSDWSGQPEPGYAATLKVE